MGSECAVPQRHNWPNYCGECGTQLFKSSRWFKHYNKPGPNALQGPHRILCAKCYYAANPQARSDA